MSSGIQKSLENSPSNRLRQHEMDISGDLEDILIHEEMLRRQKVRCDWLHLGDRHTKLFHNRTIQRRNLNCISILRLPSEEWCLDQNILRFKAMVFFENLYGEIPQSVRDLPPNFFPD